MPRRGAAPRLHHRAVRTGRDRARWSSRCGPTSTTRRSATRGWRSALQYRQVVLGPMTADQVRRAVIEPARLAQVDVEDGLVGLLLADLAPRGVRGAADGAEPGGPTPQADRRRVRARARCRCCRTRCWPPGSTAAADTLTVADYLAERRDQGRAHPDGRARLRQPDRRTSSGSPGGCSCAWCTWPTTCRRAVPPSRSASCAAGTGGADAEPVLATFVDERMITVDAETAQITHDALLTAWPRLRSWIEASTDGAAHPPADHRGRPGLGGRRAGERRAVARQPARGRQGLGGRRGQPRRRCRRWPPSSWTRRWRRGRRSPARAQRRRTRRLQAIVAVLTVLVLAVAVLTGYAFRQRQAAADARGHGHAASQSANSREVAFEADQLRAPGPARWPRSSASPPTASRAPRRRPRPCSSRAARRRRPRIVDSAGIVQSVGRQPGPPAARGGRRRRDAAAVERGRARPPVAGRARWCRPTAATRCTRRRSARTGRLLAAAGAGPRGAAVERVRPGAPGAALASR